MLEKLFKGEKKKKTPEPELEPKIEYTYAVTITIRYPPARKGLQPRDVFKTITGLESPQACWREVEAIRKQLASSEGEYMGRKITRSVLGSKTGESKVIERTGVYIKKMKLKNEDPKNNSSS